MNSPIDPKLNCDTLEEVALRCRFQDWLTTRGCGYPFTVPYRDYLWSRFKDGYTILSRNGYVFVGKGSK
jgi:hypothetical protein